MKKIVLVTAVVLSAFCMYPSGIHAEEQIVEVMKDVPSFYNIEIPKKIEIGDNEDTTFSYSVTGNLAPKEIVTINASITDISRQNSADTYEATLNLSRTEFDEDYFDNPVASETGTIHSREIKKAGIYSATMTFNVEKKNAEIVKTFDIGYNGKNVVASLYNNGLLEVAGAGDLGNTGKFNLLGTQINDPVLKDIKKIVIKDPIHLRENASHLFQGFEKVTEIKGLENLDTSDVTIIDNWFYSCYKLKVLDLSVLDLSKVESASWAFASCIGLTYLDVSSIDENKLTNKQNMFYGTPKDLIPSWYE